MNVENCGTSGNTTDTLSPRTKKRKKEKRREKKLKYKKKKKKKRKHRSSDSESENLRSSQKLKKSRQEKSSQNIETSITDNENIEVPGPSVPPELLAEQAKSRAPMTKEEWERSQKVIRRVYDESIGRSRFV